MTIFAGIFVRSKNKTIPALLITELRSTISRHPDDIDAIEEFSDNRVYLAKTDAGILKEPSVFSSSKFTAFVAGDPLFQNNQNLPGARVESLQNITHDLIDEKWEALQACRGTYCVAIYEQTKHELHLITDKLGVRPVYYWALPDFIIFATALRILEALSFQKKNKIH